MLTASRLQRAAACPASVALPQVNSESEPARRGTAIHAFLAAALEVGRELALGEVPEEYRAVCEVIDLDSLPREGVDELAAEVALAFNVASGEARELGRNIGRSYVLTEGEIAGTADLVGINPFELYVADFKTGRSAVTAAAENWQLKFLALAAARVYGVEQVRAAIIRLREDGTPEYETALFTAFDLDRAADELKELVDGVRAVEAEIAAGRTPDVTTGAHCRWCPAAPACPAVRALVQLLAVEPMSVADGINAVLTPERAAEAWGRLKLVEEVVRRVREAVYAFAKETPIPLGHGRMLGEVETKRRVLNGRVAFDVLEHLHGSAVAEAAVEVEASQASIEQALRGIVAETGGKLAPLKRSVMAELEKAGGVEVRVSRSVRDHVRDVTDSEGAAPEDTAA